MATSLITMLNRLPIYNRPKEPAIGLVIGNPVLIGTTNPNLPTIPIPPKYDHFGNLISISTGAPVTTPPPIISPRNVMLGGSSGKQLPPLPLDMGPQSTGSVRAPAQNQYEPSPSPPSNGTISRKPAPGGSVNTPPPTEAHPAFRSASRGFNPWGDPQRNLVSVENHGPRTGSRVSSPMMPPSPPHHYDNDRPVLVEQGSIDDWIHKRGNAPISPSTADGPPQPPPHRVLPRTSVEPPQLNLKLDFEPLEAPRHGGSSGNVGSSPRIPIPKDALSNLKYTPSPTDVILRSLSESISGLRPKEPTPPPEQAGPKDHISELEERREKLIARRVAIRKDIWTLEQALDPTGSNPLGQTHLKRSDIKEMIAKKNVEVDEVEKEVFDVGMLIHRAWKRRCKNGEEGSTHLWIHNVVARTSKE
ncbi:hypothetical protein EV426DRAFT_703984 [Tirmania nivea]|nr:hypothetical protein EV426DRAFT_703984 [Tirmania nivea]